MRLLRGPPYKLWTDLGLEQTGVRLIRPAKQNALPSSDGRTLVVDADLERTLAAIGRLDRADASRFAAFFEEARRLSRTVIEPLRCSPPLPPDELENHLSRSADGRRFHALASWSALDLIRERFRNERLRALLAFAAALRGYLPVLDVPGTGYVLAQAVAGLVDCSLVEGGSYQLARALAGERVAGIAVRAGRACGVALASGGFVAAGEVEQCERRWGAGDYRPPGRE